MSNLSHGAIDKLQGRESLVSTSFFLKKLRSVTSQKLWPVLSLGIIAVAGVIGSAIAIFTRMEKGLVLPVEEAIKNERIGDYTFPALQDRVYKGSQIKLVRKMQTNSDFDSYLFEFESDGKKVTGQLNMPKTEMPAGGFPIVVMIRGYVDKEIYETGVGTRNAAAYFAGRGFLTVACDFLGYGGSDPEDGDVLLARFERPVVVVNLINSLSSLKQANSERVAMWGHSNGGQIALSVLEITKRPIPTILWAPVSQPFPYSILYYVEELPDKGDYIRKQVADFEKSYNPTLFSVTAFLDQIKAPILLHQGGADEAVPQAWSDDLALRLKMSEKEITYYVYPKADHDMRGVWNTVVARDVEFFLKSLAL